jgi:hypothetical protein
MNESLHKISNDNAARLVNFATSETLECIVIRSRWVARICSEILKIIIKSAPC